MGKGSKARHKQEKRGTKQASPFIVGQSSSEPKTKKQRELEEKMALEVLLKKKRLVVQEISADGNCLFRTLSFLLHGWVGEDHSDMRAKICDFISDNQDDFAPFVEDDEGFDSYLKRMRKDGTWGSQMELCAAQRLLNCALHIYQPGRPVYVLQETTGKESSIPKLVLSLYFDGANHYNAIYSENDDTRTGKLSGSVDGEGAAGGRDGETIAVVGKGSPPGSPVRPPSDRQLGEDGEGFMVSKKEQKRLLRAKKKMVGNSMKELEDGLGTIYL